MSFLRSLTLCALVVLSEPALADKSLIDADLATCRGLNRLGVQMQQAGNVMEVWVSGGKATRDAERELDGIRRSFEGEEKALTSRSYPAAASGLRDGAIQCMRQRAKALEDARALTRHERLNQTLLRDYWRATLDTTRISQRAWFVSRKKFVPVAMQGESSPVVLDFYRWQGDVVNLWLEESEIASRAQLLLTQTYDTDAERKVLEGQAWKLVRDSLYLRSKTAALKKSATTQGCQRAAEVEQLSLVKLCEAILYLYQDPSSESTSRLRHSMHALAEASTQLEAESLATLQKAYESARGK